MRFAYADPPYFGQGKKDYGHRHAEAGVWDKAAAHLDLAGRLVDDYPDGWALSCNPKDLRMYLPALPTDVRVAAWVKTYHQVWGHITTQYAWEPVIFRGGRVIKGRNPMVRDWCSADVARGTGFKGAKSIAFNRWVLDLLGYQDGDTVDDLFPGTGSMGKTLAQGVLL